MGRFIHYLDDKGKKGLREQVYRQVKRIRAYMAMLHSNLGECMHQPPEQRNAAVERVFKGPLETCRSLMEAVGIHLTKANYRSARSAAMDRAANQYCKETGVWKVGDQHRIDMEDYDNRRYNLISQGDFQSMVDREARQSHLPPL